MTRTLHTGCLALLALALTATATFGEQAMNERYARGWKALTALAPEKAQAVQDGLADIAPDMGRYIVEFGYGDVFTRPGLDPASRQIATIAARSATPRRNCASISKPAWPQASARTRSWTSST